MGLRLGDENGGRHCALAENACEISKTKRTRQRRAGILKKKKSHGAAGEDSWGSPQTRDLPWGWGLSGWFSGPWASQPVEGEGRVLQGRVACVGYVLSPGKGGLPIQSFCAQRMARQNPEHSYFSATSC